jgi:hypothetical protein
VAADRVVLAADLARLQQLVVRQDDGGGFAVSGLFQTDGGEAIEIRGAQRNPAFAGALDLDGRQDRKRHALRDDFAEPGEGVLQLRNWERDRFHGISFLWL